MSKRSTVFGVVAILLVAALAVAGPVVAKGPGSGGGGGGYGGGGGAGGGGGTPGGGGGGEGEEPSAVNNLSFPAIGVDGYALAAVPESFSVQYTGTYPGLTPEEIAALGSGPWYPQKTAGNTWQADFEVATAAVAVSYVDWGDNIESVNPKIMRPFRLEVVLFKQLDAPMTRYTMAELEYPSSSNELQGTNKVKTESYFATVASPLPKLVIQYYGASVPTGMTWNVTQWNLGTVVPVSFATELNVGGKLIYGASQGGWKPDKTGWYRITFYSPAGSGVSLASAVVGNYADFSVPPPSELTFSAAAEDGGDEGGAATPVVVGSSNLSYVDVQVTTGGGGGGGGGKPR